MLRIGLTGGIASGKSTVSRCLARLGALVVDADVLARQVVAPGTPGLAAVVAAFGADVIGPDGALDRPVLARIVFADGTARRRLEEITHPLVRAAAERAEAETNAAVVVHDIPLLAEKGHAPRFHAVLVTEATAGERVRRMVDERGLSEAQAWERIAAQASDEQRRAVADVVLPGGCSVQERSEMVDALWRQRLRPWARNIAEQTGTCPAAVRPSPVPDQPGAGERQRRRVEHALARAGLAERTRVMPAGRDEPGREDVTTALRPEPDVPPAALDEALAWAGFFPSGAAAEDHLRAGPGRVFLGADPARFSCVRVLPG